MIVLWVGLTEKLGVVRAWSGVGMLWERLEEKLASLAMV